MSTDFATLVERFAALPGPVVSAQAVLTFYVVLEHIDAKLSGEPRHRLGMQVGKRPAPVLTRLGWLHMRVAVRKRSGVLIGRDEVRSCHVVAFGPGDEMSFGQVPMLYYTNHGNSSNTWTHYMQDKAVAAYDSVRAQMLREDRHAVRHNLLPLLVGGRIPGDVVRFVLAPLLLELPSAASPN